MFLPGWRVLLESRCQQRLATVTQLSLAYHDAAERPPGGHSASHPAAARQLRRLMRETVAARRASPTPRKRWPGCRRAASAAASSARPLSPWPSLPRSPETRYCARAPTRRLEPVTRAHWWYRPDEEPDPVLEGECRRGQVVAAGSVTASAWRVGHGPVPGEVRRTRHDTTTLPAAVASMTARILGPLLILAPFGRAQPGRVSARSRPCRILNLAGSAALAGHAATGSQWGFLRLEGAWVVTSLGSTHAVRSQAGRGAPLRRPVLRPNLRDLEIGPVVLIWGNAVCWGLAAVVEWLPEGKGDGRAEQFEGRALDGCRAGEFLDFLAVEGHGLAVEGGQVVEQVAVFADG